MSDLCKHGKVVPLSFKKEVHNAADWVFLTCTSMGVPKAARYLGIGYHCLLKNVDRFGLTVVYRNRGGKSGRVDKYFLVSELKRLKEKIESLSFEDALKSAEDHDGYFRKDQKHRQKIRRLRKSRAG